MNGRWLKYLALITMVIDHVGHFLLPDLIILRVIGRLAFPIFTYLFAQSARSTSNRLNFGIRLIIAAFVGQVIMFIFGATEIISIFFLFTLALAMFELIDRGYRWSLIIFASIAELFGVDYGAYGIFVLYFFYQFHNQKNVQMISYILVTLFYAFLPLLNPDIWPYLGQIFSEFFSTSWRYFIQVLSVLALIPIYFTHTQKPKALPKPFNTFEKYFFYVFYPLHIALLAYLRGI